MCLFNLKSLFDDCRASHIYRFYQKSTRNEKIIKIRSIRHPHWNANNTVNYPLRTGYFDNHSLSLSCPHTHPLVSSDLLRSLDWIGGVHTITSRTTIMKTFFWLVSLYYYYIEYIQILCSYIPFFFFLFVYRGKVFRWVLLTRCVVRFFPVQSF